MGRYIYCMINNEYETVWKYVLRKQESEMYRINEELRLGSYYIEDHYYPKTSWLKTFRRLRCLKRLSQFWLNRKVLHYYPSTDLLILGRNDIPRLSRKLKRLKQINHIKKHDGDTFFLEMLEAILNFMLNHPKEERFIFESEF